MNATQPVFQEILNRVCPPKFKVTYCSQCGESFGPGNHGYSHCSGHKAQSWHKENDAAALALQIKYQGATA